MWVDGRVARYALCFLVLQVKFSNSRTSWRLSADRVVKATEFALPVEDDPIFDILTASIDLSNGQSWSKTAFPGEQRKKVQIYCNECKNIISAGHDRNQSPFSCTIRSAISGV